MQASRESQEVPREAEDGIPEPADTGSEVIG